MPRKLGTRDSSARPKFFSASRLLNAFTRDFLLELMPKLKHGNRGHAHGKGQKLLAKNKDHAAARDAAALKRAADATEAELLAAAEALAALESPPQPPAEAQPPAEQPEPEYVPSNGEMQAYKRMAIVCKYQMLGCPPESEWSQHGGVLRQIADHLDMPDPCDYRPIRETLQRYLADEDVWHSKGGQGRKPKLAYGQFLISADCLRRGTGQEQAAHTLTAWRESKGMPEEKAAVGRHCIRTAVEKLGGVCQRRGTTSTGNRDPESKWATSRDAQAQQWEGQVELPEDTAALLAPGPKLSVDGRRIQTRAKDPLSLLGNGIVIKPLGSTWPNQSKADRKKRWPCELVGYVDEYTYVNGDVEAAYIIQCEGHRYPMRVDDVVKLLPAAVRPADGGGWVLGRIPLESISWWDEKHKQIVLGSHASKHEYRFPTSPGGTHKPVEEGGVLQAREPRKKAKYTGDGGRYGFGVMMKRNADGELEGHKMEPFNYSDSWLCGPKKYWEREKAELARVADFTGDGWGEAGRGISEATEKLPGGRYQVRYPKTWRKELKLACSKTLGSKDAPSLKGYICVTDLMDHVVSQSKEAFADTPYADSFVLFHDALKQWWEPEAQQHLLEKHGIGPTRQLCIQGDTNEAVAAHYRNKLVGDSPELCPLDSNLFSDYEFAMRQNLAYSYWLPHNAEGKFLSGTPSEIQDLMERTWAHDGAVTSERIVEDICRWPAALKAIIEAKGAKVEWLDNRKGRRQSKPYQPPRIEAVEELMKARFERFESMTPTTVPDAALPPKKRQRRVTT